MDPNLERKEALFEAALQLASPAEWTAYLDAACGDDPKLRRQIELMLADEAGAEEFFRSIASLGDSVRELAVETPSQSATQIAEGPGTVIGRYTLIERLGEGGFGVVYLAEQREPVARQVALKIIKPGLDTREVVARFEAERQALALMDHPNIARVLDGGATEIGRPYFVMDLVRGVSITEYCDTHRLATRQRLELFIKVCQAVQHAHQKGIIHRDLKPANVLIAQPEPGRPAEPKVIDFGIAKALNQRLTARTLVTRRDQLMGTPEYMSPEQADGSGADVDTRSDIYSLGAMLYELLTGTPPFERETLKRCSLEEIRRMIRETEPARPSTRLKTLGARATEVANQRRIEPAALNRLLQGDLDWIVMKCLEKDRSRRYETVTGLARDLERYLNHEPVTARPPSGLYRCQKFVRRNKLAVAASTAVLLALVIGLTLAMLGFARAQRERNRAQTEAAIARAISEFLQKDLLLQSNPSTSASYGTNRSELKLFTVLDRASEKIEGRFPDQPLVEAAIRFTLGQCYGDHQSGERHVRRAIEIYERELGPDAPETLEARQFLGYVILFHDQSQDKPTEAIRMVEQVLDARRRVLGPKHPDTLKSMHHLANIYWNIGATSEAERLLEEGFPISRQVLADKPGELVEWIELLAWVKRSKGDDAEAGRLLTEVYEIYTRERGPNDPQTLQAGTFLSGHLIHSSQDYPRAEPLLLDLLERCRRELRSNDSITITLENDRAHLLREKRFLGEAERLFIETANRSRQTRGTDTPDSLALPAILSSFYSVYGYYSAAEDHFRPAYDRMRTVLDPRHEYVLQALDALAELELAQARFEEAVEHRRELVELTRQNQGPGSPRHLRFAEALADLYGRLGRWEACAEVYAELARYDTNNAAMCAVGMVPTWLAGKPEAATSLAREAVNRFGQGNDPVKARQVAQAGLLLPAGFPELGPVLRMADLVAAKGTNPRLNQLVNGMALLRQAKPEDARQQLRLLQQDHDAVIASQAGYFVAMAHHQLGQSAAAKQALAQANERLASATRPGDLLDRWVGCGGALITRAEAERLILGQTASPPINAFSLAAARISWSPVRALLEAGDGSARRREWEKARGAFLEAIRTALFDWSAAEIQDPFLRSRIALVLLMAGDFDGYAEICRPSLERARLDAASPHAQAALKAVLIGWRHHSPGLQQQALDCANAIKADESTRRTTYWSELCRGMVEFRAGNHEVALTLLDKAETSYDRACGAAALAFRAMNAQRLGQVEQAQADLNAAKEILVRLQDRPFGDLGNLWMDVILCELGVNEAEQLIRSAGPSAAQGAQGSTGSAHPPR